MKSAPEKSLSYTAVVVLVSIVLFIVVGAILTPLRGLGGLATMGGLWAPRPAVISTIGVQGGTATVNLGQLQAAANQMAAQTSALRNSTAAPVKSADPQALLALMPQSFQGSALANPSTSSGGVAGMNASSATASYSVNGGTITLKIADSGSMAAVGGMLQAVNLNTSTSSAGGYEKVSSQNGQMVTEKYDTADKSGEYGIVLNGRTSIEADGSNVDMPTIKSLVAMIDIGKAQSLTK